MQGKYMMQVLWVLVYFIMYEIDEVDEQQVTITELMV